MPDHTKISFAEWWEYERSAIRRAEIKVPIFIRGGTIAVIAAGITYFGLTLVGIAKEHETAVTCIISACAGVAAFILVFGVEFVIKLMWAHAKMDNELNEIIEAAQKTHIKEKHLLEEKIHALSNARENEEKAAFIKASVKEIMANQLTSLEMRIGEICDMSGIGYNNSKKDGRDVATNEFLDKISSFLKKFVSPDSAILFLSKTGIKHTPIPPQLQGFGCELEKERYAVIDNLNHFAAQLKEIIKNH